MIDTGATDRYMNEGRACETALPIRGKRSAVILADDSAM